MSLAVAQAFSRTPAGVHLLRRADESERERERESERERERETSVGVHLLRRADDGGVAAPLRLRRRAGPAPVIIIHNFILCIILYTS